MINLYAYTYPSAVELIDKRNGLWVKIGDTHRAPKVRMDEQGGAAEPEDKVVVGKWMKVDTIERDYVLHRILAKRGLRRKTEFTGKGTEWFNIPVKSVKEANQYISDLIDEIGGEGSSLKEVKLRKMQEKTLDQAMDIIRQSADNDQNVSNIIANLCPRFGKTIWALSLFNRITEEYGNRIMLLPAYWLSVHGSFSDEIQEFREFMNMDVISTKDDNAEEELLASYEEGRQIVVELSLHGEIDTWKEKHEWIRDISEDEFFVFSDEADFGSHTTNQVEKLQWLFS